MRHSAVLHGSILLAALICSASIALAQKVKVPAATGTLTGEVTDKHGTPLAGTAVTVTNLANKQSTSSTTDAQGIFRVDSLFPAEYEITYSAKSFMPKTEKVKIKAGKTEKVHAHLVYVPPSS